jgi:hypothetical protein
LMVTSNHAIGDQQLATLTRMLQVAVYRQPDGDPNSWDEMVEAMAGASGCLPDLIKLGYPKAEIKELERELRSHLPKSHPRIASSMALITWYAMAVAQLADFDTNSIKQYAINHLCPIANAADTNGDSVADFLDKLSALKSEALVGDWNCILVEARGEKALAVQMSQVFPLIDKHFNPVYSRKVLEALIAKAGGTLQSVQKFHSNRDESLAYYRAKITAEGEPTEPEYKPKRCVLIPFHLIKGFTDDWKEPPPSPPSSDGGGSNSPHNNSPCDNGGEGVVTSPVTPVTASYSQLPEKCNQQAVEPVSVSAVLDSPVTSFSDHSIKQNQQRWDAIAEALGQTQNTHTLIPEKDVTEEDLEPETVAVTESERLHISCNFDVTDCNQEEKDVTEHPTPDHTYTDINVATKVVVKKDNNSEVLFLAERFRFYTQRSEFKALVKPFVTANRCEVIEAAIAQVPDQHRERVQSDWEWCKTLGEEACPPAEPDEQEWAVGDRVIVDTDVPTLKEFNNRFGIVEAVKHFSGQCLLSFDGGEYMHIPFRGLRRIE